MICKSRFKEPLSYGAERIRKCMSATLFKTGFGSMCSMNRPTPETRWTCVKCKKVMKSYYLQAGETYCFECYDLWDLNGPAPNRGRKN